MKNRSLFSATGLALTGFFLLLSVAVISAFPRLRIDLTQDKLFTLADGTRSIVSGLEKPIDLLFFYSEDATADIPQIRTYGTRVLELLNEMAIASDGNVNLRAIDPVPFSEEEDLAAEYGVQPVPVTQGGEEVFFGLVALDPSTLEEGQEKVFETIPLIRPDQEEYLEYEFSKLITQVANPEPPIVGVMSTIPIDGGVNPATMDPISPIMLMDNIRQLYTVQRVAPDAQAIGMDIDILIVAHPQELGEQTLYAIDQHVMRGGKVLLFLDPNADSQSAPGPDGVPFVENQASDLEPLLSAWGIEYDSQQAVADKELALMVSIGDSPRPLPHYGMMGIQRPGFANDIVTNGLQVMNFSSVGALSPIEGASTTFEPLIRSSADSMLMESSFFKSLTDPTILLDEFMADDQRYTIAARVTGELQSAFPQGRPATDTGEDVDAEQAERAAMIEHINETDGVASIIVVADTDFLGDRLWVQVQNIFGQRVGQAFASNGDFVMNSLDNLAGESELATIRSRGRYARPFQKVLELQRAADTRLRAEERELLEDLQRTEQQISALNAGREGNEVTPEQQAEVDRFYQRQLETRRRLREVQLGLNRDIERLGATLKFINTALVPILLVLFVLGLGFIRRRRS
ncbi:MAG: Gldg family protein [Pseudohongiellaceae bacterium]|nr:Gldg family protein [Pseudohongiellaceae bacterium]